MKNGPRRVKDKLQWDKTSSVSLHREVGRYELVSYTVDGTLPAEKSG